MDILTGGCLGNNIKIWKENIKTLRKAMDIFLATPSTIYTYSKEIIKDKLFILESFYYVKDWMDVYIKNYWNFMLDSGAFTFMTSKKNIKINWDKYVEDYAKYINRLDIKLFFELDIDSVVGLKEVERLRVKLEKLTNKKCIPVWHKSRGKEYWLQMVKDYDYVAFGGILTDGIKTKKIIKYFPWFIQTAHQNNCKIHGLGFTNMKALKELRLDSVDSTSWTSGNRFGLAYWFDGKTMQKQNKKKGQRVKTKEVAIHNFKEWVKFQKYAEVNL